MSPQVVTPKLGRWWWLAVASFLVCLLVLAPAALIEWAAHQSPNQTVQFIADSGTIWAGRGRITVAADRTPLVLPVVWRFDARALLDLRIGFFIAANAPALSGSARIASRFGDIQLRETAFSADAGLLTIAYRSAVIFAPLGRIRLQQTGDERLVMRPATSANQVWRVDGVNGFLAENNLTWTQVQGVGLAIPGPYERYGVMGRAANLPRNFEGWDFHADYSRAIADAAGRSIPLVTGNDGNYGGGNDQQDGNGCFAIHGAAP